MHQIALASLAFEVGERVGDTSAAFLTKIKTFLNDRYDDALLRCGATMWSGASLSALGDSDIPLLGLGKVIKEGGIADAWATKRQYNKSTVHEQKYEFALSNYVISQDYTQFNISFSRYEAYP
jgi:hypothetical protein